ncbi:MAG: hemagglutinin [Ketobacter sp. GenoA1]|nr:MAG: hemagglutinin [Ketobacter sp. GenoA1]
MVFIAACGGGGGGDGGTGGGGGSDQTQSSDSGNNNSENDGAGSDTEGNSGTGDSVGGSGDATDSGITSPQGYAYPVVVSLWSDDVAFGEGRIIDDTIAFSGTAQPRHTIEFWLNDVMNGSTVADSNGDWRLDFSLISLSPGDYTIDLVSIAPNGDRVASQRPFAFRYDPTAPASPIVEAISDDSYIAGDGYTSDGSLVIDGTAEPSMNVTLYLNGIAIGNSVADSDGVWSVDYTVVDLADGSYMLTADATFLDLQSATSPQFPLVVDRQAPVAPANLLIFNDSGASNSDLITNDNTLLFSGVTEPFARVRLRRDAQVMGSAQADAAGNWVFDYSAVTIQDGVYGITLEATDRAGNQSLVSSAFTLIMDTVAPDPVTSMGLQPDTGVVGDGVTSTGAVQIFGTAQPEESVELFLDGASAGVVTVDANGDWLLDLTSTPLSNGTYAITTQTIDIAGNRSALSGDTIITISGTIPATPVITGVTSDSGLASDGITADNTLFIQGTAGVGIDVVVYLDTVEQGTASTDLNGDWVLDLTATTLSDGAYVITAMAEDGSGLQSGISSDFNLLIDTTAPLAPAIISFTTDTGALGDQVTSDSTLVFSGSAEANASIELFIDAGSIGTTTADGSGNWSFDHTGTTLADGSYAITAVASDLSGNTSATSSALNITVDTAAPAAPAVTAITDDTGTAGDGITSDNQLIFSGTAEANASVEVFVDAGSIGTTTADGSGNWSYDHTGNTLADGGYAITAIATDSSGNTSTTSNVFSVIVVTSGLAAPIVTAISVDTGTPSDGITSDNQLVISGTAEANASVEVFIDAGSIGTTTADGSGNWSFDHTGTTLADGSYAITAVASDLSGNTSATSSALNITVDTATPAAPAVTAITDDTGTAGDGITSDNQLIFSGTAEANASVEVFVDAGSIGTTTADGSGNWSYDHTGTTLADGSYAITAVATDSSGNGSAISNALNITVDAAAPVAPTVMAITDDTGTAGDGITSDNQLIISGTAEPNTSVEVFIGGGSIGITAADGSGNWSYDHTGTTLADGGYAITATATDSSGNTSTPSSVLNVIVVTSGLAAPIVTAISVDTGIPLDGITSDNQLVISGTAEANASVEVFIDAGSIGTATADGSGNWSYDHTGISLADGSYAITAVASDLSGNTSATSSVLNITVDTAAPAAPAVTAITDDTGTASDGITSDNQLVISGTSEANASVEVFIDAGSIGTTTADGSGNWSFDHTGTTLADGSYAITTAATDASGNTSAASSALNITVDTAAPAAPSVSAITDDTGTASDGITSDNQLIITGTAEANASVEVFIDAGSIGTTTADGSGNWSFDHTSTTLADGSYAITAAATDASGNTSATSSALNITIDTSAPTAPAVTTITDDTGTASDGITSDNQLIITGTAQANASVDVFIDAGSIGTTTADGSGNWSFDHTGTTLSDGSYAITAAAMDASGNTSAASSALNITVDTAAPVAPAVTTITDDTGTASDGITSDSQLIITGTAEANASVEVFIDAGSIGTTTADGSGNWSFDHTSTTLADGSYAITAAATDVSGNTSAASSALNITVDTAAPSAPTVAAITDDTGTASDGITSDSQLIITGTAEANASVEVFIDAGSIGTTTADGSGNWSFDHTGTTLSDGSYAITAAAMDASGNTSAASSALNVTVDTAAPAAPAVTAITDDTGAASDGITSDNQLVITGTAEANASVEVFIDAGSIGTTTADGSGNWSYDHSGNTLADGGYAITAAATDASGNTSATSSALNITVDTAAPSAPTVAAITDDTGTASDGITSDNQLIITGTAEANASVEVFIDAGSIGTTTADGSGNWSFDHTSTTLADGSYAITAAATDVSGNTSAASSALNITVDTAAPAAPSVSAITDDTGTASDGITSDNQLVITGTAEANASVEVFIDAGSIGTTTADGSGNWSFDHTGTTLSDGSYAITAAATDASGNTSAASSALNITVDTAAPVAPAVTTITDDTGTASDGITSDNQLIITGTAEANASVEVFIDAGSIGTTTADGSGNWSFDHTGTTLADGSYAITAAATDASGNTSAASSALNITVDTAAPAAPSVSAITDDTGTASDGITSDNQLVITGTAEANASVEVFIDAGSIGTTTADGSGNWSYDHTGTTLADGSYAITAAATDASGNTSAASSALNITVDTAAPSAPTVAAITDDTGTASDGITSDNQLIITGTAEANASVEVFIDAGSIGTTTADGSGNWSFDHTGTTLADGSYAITAAATDASGNTSAASSALNITVDTAAPVAPAVTTITDDTGTASDGITSDNQLIITGTAEANASVEVFIDAGSIGTTTADGSGNWSFDHTSTTLADGSYAITAAATDASGNTSATSSALNITVDTAAPSAPTVAAITDDTGTASDGITSDNQLIITGTAEANASVEVFIDAGSIGTATADGSGNWSYDHTGTTLADGGYAVTAAATDASGNTSSTSSALNITIDTSAPSVPAVTSITDDTGTASDGITSDNQLVITGTAEANASVEVFIDAGSIGTATADGSGNWSFDHTGTTLADGSYAITAAATDASGNTSSTSSALNITVDTAAPSVSSYSPANGETSVVFSSNLVMTFDDSVYVSTGNVVIRRYIDDSIVETIDITSGQVTGGGTANITINSTADLGGCRSIT